LNEIEKNIKNDNKCNMLIKDDEILLDLVLKMLENNPNNRIKSNKLLKHPYFLNIDDKLKIIQYFSNLTYNKSKNENLYLKINNETEKKKFDLIYNKNFDNEENNKNFNWKNQINLFENKLNINLITNTQKFMKRNVNYENINDLIRIIRNLISHVDDYSNTNLINIYNTLNEVFPKFFINIYNLYLKFVSDNSDNENVKNEIKEEKKSLTKKKVDDKKENEEEEEEENDEEEEQVEKKLKENKKLKYLISIGQQYKKFIIGKKGIVKMNIERKFNVKINCPINGDNIFVIFNDEKDNFKLLLKYILRILSKFGVYKVFYKKL
jgi:hypothetical protein